MSIEGHRSRKREAGYTTYFVAVFLLIFATLAVMHVMLVMSAATTSRAWDHFRQGEVEKSRLERAVTETVLAFREVSVAGSTSRTSVEEFTWQLGQMDAGGAVVSVTGASEPPIMVMFPDIVAPPTLSSPSAELIARSNPELLNLFGPSVSESASVTYRVVSKRVFLNQEYSYPTTVTATLVSVPLTRYSVAAYDLPNEIAKTPVVLGGPKPTPTMPQGLVSTRDQAFLSGLRSSGASLPYAYRRRASIASAYQYVFSQAYMDRVAEYAGITHYCNLDAAPGATAQLSGLTVNAGGGSWDLGLAGTGTYTTVTLNNNAAVVFTATGGKTLTLSDSVLNSNATPMLLVLSGPANTALGPLTVVVGNVNRPILIIGYNIRVQSASGVVFKGGILVDPASSIPAGTGPLHVGHVSYWGGATDVSNTAIMADIAFPDSLKVLAPRVNYVVTTSKRL